MSNSFINKSLSFSWISYSDFKVVNFFIKVWFSRSILWAMFLIHSNYDIICFYFSRYSWSFSLLFILSSLNFSFISFIFLWKNRRMSDSCSIKILDVLFWMVPILSSIYLWSSVMFCILFRSAWSKEVLHLSYLFNTLFRLATPRWSSCTGFPFPRISAWWRLFILPERKLYPAKTAAPERVICIFNGSRWKSFLREGCCCSWEWWIWLNWWMLFCWRERRGAWAWEHCHCRVFWRVPGCLRWADWRYPAFCQVQFVFGT